MSARQIIRRYRLKSFVDGNTGIGSILPGLDLRSDTITIPSQEIRQIMASAKCGDDVYNEDISITEFENYMAELTGKESALCCLTGTMSNFLAVISQCNQGEEVLGGDNYLGGIPLDLKYLENLAKLKENLGFRVHTDGARLVNGSIALEKPLRDLCQFSDTVSMCFTKGLGYPFGAVLLGSEEVIARARRARKAIGGQWRQGGKLPFW